MCHRFGVDAAAKGGVTEPLRERQQRPSQLQTKRTRNRQESLRRRREAFYEWDVTYERLIYASAISVVKKSGGNAEEAAQEPL